MSEETKADFLGIAEWFENLDGDRAITIVMIINGVAMLLIYGLFLCTWISMVVGASCLGLDEYDHCGSFEGAIVMIVLGVFFCMATLLCLVATCVICPLAAYKPELMSLMDGEEEYSD